MGEHCCGCEIARAHNRRFTTLLIVVALVAGVVGLVALSLGNTLAAVGFGIITVQWAGTLGASGWRRACTVHGSEAEAEDPPRPPAAA